MITSLSYIPESSPSPSSLLNTKYSPQRNPYCNYIAIPCYYITIPVIITSRWLTHITITSLSPSHRYYITSLTITFAITSLSPSLLYWSLSHRYHITHHITITITITITVTTISSLSLTYHYHITSYDCHSLSLSHHYHITVIIINYHIISLSLTITIILLALSLSITSLARHYRITVITSVSLPHHYHIHHTRPHRDGYFSSLNHSAAAYTKRLSNQNGTRFWPVFFYGLAIVWLFSSFLFLLPQRYFHC